MSKLLMLKHDIMIHTVEIADRNLQQLCELKG